MKLTEDMLRKLVVEEMEGLSGGGSAASDPVHDIVTQWLSEANAAYDEGDPSMAGARGLIEWHAQVKRAAQNLELELRDRIDEALEAATAGLINGEYY